jgi:DNA recombination protein RmuC
MNIFLVLLLLFLGALLGMLVIWFERRGRVQSLEAALAETRAALGAAQAEAQARQQEAARALAERAGLEATLQHERAASADKLRLLADAQAQLTTSFKALSADALKSNNDQFLKLAEENLKKFQATAQGDLEQKEKAVAELVKPIRESLEKVNTQVQELEKTRALAYGGLSEQVKSLLLSQQKLESETGNLVKALRAPTVRGRWGEMQLRRVVEIAGMLPHCDFDEQVSVGTEDGRLRPDLTVRLPGGKVVVVDAKAPLQAYLSALEAPDDAARLGFLQDHARQIQTHLRQLSAKAYWDQFDATPEFVVMFLPGEVFFSAALEQNPGLIEEGVNQRVILATPTTLIALLRAVAYGWRQETIAESAQAISRLGADLYDRLAIMAEHFGKVGVNLERATKSYNDTVGSLERNVLPAARKFTELGVASNRELALLEPAETAVREIQAKELRPKGKLLPE